MNVKVAVVAAVEVGLDVVAVKAPFGAAITLMPVAEMWAVSTVRG
jgi:hypothetical protein